jgi:hypothetical protein
MRRSYMQKEVSQQIYYITMSVCRLRCDFLLKVAIRTLVLSKLDNPQNHFIGLRWPPESSERIFKWSLDLTKSRSRSQRRVVQTEPDVSKEHIAFIFTVNPNYTVFQPRRPHSSRSAQEETCISFILIDVSSSRPCNLSNRLTFRRNLNASSFKVEE